MKEKGKKDKGKREEAEKREAHTKGETKAEAREERSI